MKCFCVKDYECFLLFPGDTPENVKAKRDMYGQAHYFPSVTETYAANCVVYDKNGDTCYGAVLVTYDPWEATLTLDMENITELRYRKTPLRLTEKIVNVFRPEHPFMCLQKVILHQPTLTDSQKEQLCQGAHYQERPGYKNVFFVHVNR